MDQKLEFLTNLPSEIIINIISELPVRTIISCKCVCKSLFQIIETPDFAKFHLSKSVPGLIVYDNRIHSNSFKIFEFKDELGVQKHDRYVPIAEFNCRAFFAWCRSDITMEGSANGLLLINKHIPNELYICNPITREYINLPKPKLVFGYHKAVTYGFGICNKTDQYKVVRISYECVRGQYTNSLLCISEAECRVYTLGTRTWRSVPHYSFLEYKDHSQGAFINGNLHWLVCGLEESLCISCFDIETERFKLLSLPHSLPSSGRFLGHVVVLGDHLCFCDDDTLGNKIVIWVMKKYGVEKSWTKEFVINTNIRNVYPIKVFRDGDILLLWEVSYLVNYSKKNKTILYNHMSKPRGVAGAGLYVSSFLSLKSFEMENVAKF